MTRPQPQKTILFVDAGVAKTQQLIQNLNPGVEVFFIDSNLNGIEQITQVLAQRHNINSISIISHGSQGRLQLGNGELNRDNLQGYHSQLQQWGKALTADGDILLFGCQVAEGTEGQDFIQQLSQLTGADIAASDDLTGHQRLGGNWDLEVQTGNIEARTAISAEAQESFTNILGLRGEYFNGRELSRLVGTKEDDKIEFNWGSGQPNVNGKNVSPDNEHFSIRWNGYIYAPTEGLYTFNTPADDGILLWVSNKRVINDFIDADRTRLREGSIYLTPGYHPLTLEYYENRGDANIQLRWKTPFNSNLTVVPSENLLSVNHSKEQTINNTGLQGTYYNNDNFTDQKFDRVDSTVHVNYLKGSPNVPTGGTNLDIDVENFSIIWEGYLIPTASGNHTISIKDIDDEVTLEFAGQSKKITFGNLGSIASDLKAGQAYPIKLSFKEFKGDAGIKLEWEGPSVGGRQPIHFNNLYPGTTPPPRVWIEKDSILESSESSGKASFKIKTSGSIPATGIDVFYKVTGVNGAKTDDFSDPQKGKIFLNSSEAILEININNDIIPEGDLEGIQVELLPAPWYQTGESAEANNSSVIRSIIDNEPTISLTKIQDGEEGEESGKFIVTFDKPAANEFNLKLQIAGTAIQGRLDAPAVNSDYKLFYEAYDLNQNLIESGAINPSSDPAIPVPKDTETIALKAEPINNELYESNETVIVTLKDNNNQFYKVNNSQNSATVTLRDNEPTVSLGKVVMPTEGFGLGSTIQGLGYALNLDGKTYVSIPQNPKLDLSLIGQFTQEAWIFPNSSNSNQGIFGYQETSDKATNYPSVEIINGSGIKVGFGDGRKWNGFTVDNALNPQTWNHVAATFDGEEYKLYVNGVEIYTDERFAGTKPANTQQLEIGKVNNNYFEGVIDEVRLWNVARSATEIQSQMLTPLQGEEAGLIGYWKFEGNTLDSSQPNRQTFQPADGIPNFTSGLIAEYFSDKNFKNLVFSRIDQTVNNNWQTQVPASGVPANDFTVRWMGQIVPSQTDDYTFYTVSDDGVRLWVNDQFVIDNWNPHVATEDKTQPIKLEAGKAYNIRLEYYEDAGDARIELSWSGNNLAKEIIPSDQFRPLAFINNPAPQIGYVEVNLDKPFEGPQGLWVKYDISGNATQEVDYFNSQYQKVSTNPNTRRDGIIIPQGQTQGRIYIIAKPDEVRETNEKVNITIQPHNFDNEQGSSLSNTNYYVDQNNKTLDLTITDNTSYQSATEIILLDQYDRQITANNPLSVSADEKATFKVKLASQPPTDNTKPQVKIEFKSGRSTLQPQSSIFFTKDNWDQPQTVTLNNLLQSGLQGEYFSDKELKNRVLSRPDQTVNFNWGQTSPNAALPNDNFSARWTGLITPTQTQDYTFYTVSDDGVRLWVNDQLIINNWTNHAPIEDKSQAIKLEAGQFYNIRLEYYEAAGGSQIQLLWSSASQAKQIIPASQFPSLNTANNISVSSSFVNSSGNFVSNYTNTATTLPLTTTPSQLLQVTEGSESDATPVTPQISIEKLVDGVEGNDQPGQFVINLNAPAPQEGLTLEYTVSGTAKLNEDYTPTTESEIQQIQIPAGATRVILPFSIIDNPLPENQEDITVTLKSGTGYTLNATRSKSSLNIVDNDPLGIEIANVAEFTIEKNDTNPPTSETNYAYTTPFVSLVTGEDGKTDTVGVRLQSKPTANVTIQLKVSDATEGEISLATLTFTPENWDQYQKVTVTGQNDSFQDGDIRYAINGTAKSSDSQYNDKTVFIPIINLDNETAAETTQDPSTPDDAKAPIATVSVVQQMSETQPGQIKIELSEPIASDSEKVTLLFAAQGGSATVNQDYRFVNNVLVSVSDSPFGTQNPGAGSKPTFGDTDQDGDLDAVVGTATGEVKYYENIGSNTLKEKTGTNNPFSTIKLTSNAAPTLVDLNGDGKLDLVLGEGNGALSFYVNKSESSNLIFLSSQTLNIANPFANIKAVGNSTPTFGDLNKDGKVDLILGSSNGNLSYYPNQGSSSTQPLFSQSQNLNLNVSQNSTPHLVDWDADGDLDLLAGNSSGKLTYFQNTGSATQPEFSQKDDQNPLQGITPNTNVAISLVDLDSDGDLDAVAGDDEGIHYYQQYQTVDFLPGEQSKKLTIQPINDWIDEGEKENLEISLIPNQGYRLESQGSMSVKLNITDNDTAGVKITPTNPSKITTSETGEQILEYSVSLQSQPTDIVKVDLGSNDASEAQLKTSASNATLSDVIELEFTPENWDQPQKFLVQGVDDQIADGDIPYQVIPTTSSEDLQYRQLEISPISLINKADVNDKAEIVVTKVGNAGEGNDNLYKVKLTSQPVGEVRVIANPTNDQIRLNTEDFGDRTTLVFDETNWNIEQIVRVSAFDDSLVEFTHNSQIEFQVETGEKQTFESKAVNNTANSAIDLGEIKGGSTWENLAIAGGDRDWFKFTLPDAGSALDFAQIQFSNGETSDLQFKLYKSTDLTTPIVSNGTIANLKKLSLNGLERGEYFLEIYSPSRTTSEYNLILGDEDYQYVNYVNTDKQLKSLDVQIKDNDLVTAQIIAGPTASEISGQPGYFTIALNAPAPKKVGDTGIKVNYEILKNSSATENQDYQITNTGAIRIAPGDAQNNLIIVPIDDKLTEDLGVQVTKVVNKTTSNGKTTLTLDLEIPNVNQDKKGLQAQYFSGREFQSQILSKIDSTVDFIWRQNSPNPGVPADDFSVRWTGQVLPNQTENYTFYTISDDGVRLWINDQLVIDNWTPHAATENKSQAIKLEAGKAYDIRLEYYEAGGDSQIQLLWSSPSQNKQIIPVNRLVPVSGSATSPQIVSGRELMFGDGLVAKATKDVLFTKDDRGNFIGQVTVEVDDENASKITANSQAKVAGESVIVRLLPGEGYRLGDENTEASLVIQDDDVPGIRIVEVGEHTTVEEDKTATFAVSLLSEPTKPVILTLTPGAEVEFVNPINQKETQVPQQNFSFDTTVASKNNLDVKLNSLVKTDKGDAIAFEIKLKNKPTKDVKIKVYDGNDQNPQPIELTFTPQGAIDQVSGEAKPGNWDEVQEVIIYNLDKDGSGQYKVKAEIDGKTLDLPIDQTTTQVEKQTTSITINPEDWYKLKTVTIQGSSDEIAEPGIYHTSEIKYQVTSEDTNYNNVLVPDQTIQVVDRQLNPQETASALNQGLGLLQESIDSLSLPLVGNLDDKNPNLLGDLGLELAKETESENSLTANKLQEIIKNVLDLEKFGLDSFNVTTDITEQDIAIQIDLSKQLDYPVPLASDLGVPALGIGFDTEGNLNANLNFDMSLAFGLHKQFGFYIDTKKTQIDAGIKVDLQNFKGKGNLGFLQLDFADDPKNPTKLEVSFSANLNDLDDITTQKKTSTVQPRKISEIESETDVIDVDATSVESENEVKSFKFNSERLEEIRESLTELNKQQSVDENKQVLADTIEAENQAKEEVVKEQKSEKITQNQETLKQAKSDSVTTDSKSNKKEDYDLSEKTEKDSEKSEQFSSDQSLTSPQERKANPQEEILSGNKLNQRLVELGISALNSILPSGEVALINGNSEITLTYQGTTNLTDWSSVEGLPTLALNKPTITYNKQAKTYSFASGITINSKSFNLAGSLEKQIIDGVTELNWQSLKVSEVPVSDFGESFPALKSVLPGTGKVGLELAKDQIKIEYTGQINVSNLITNLTSNLSIPTLLVNNPVLSYKTSDTQKQYSFKSDEFDLDYTQNSNNTYRFFGQRLPIGDLVTWLQTELGIENIDDFSGVKVDLEITPEQKQVSFEGNIDLTQFIKAIIGNNNLPIPSLKLEDPSFTYRLENDQKQYSFKSGKLELNYTKDSDNTYSFIGKGIPIGKLTNWIETELGINNIANIVTGNANLNVTPTTKELGLEGSVDISELVKAIAKDSNLPIPSLNLDNPILSYSSIEGQTQYEFQSNTVAINYTKNADNTYALIAEKIPIGDLTNWIGTELGISNLANFIKGNVNINVTPETKQIAFNGNVDLNQLVQAITDDSNLSFSSLDIKNPILSYTTNSQETQYSFSSTDGLGFTYTKDSQGQKTFAGQNLPIGTITTLVQKQLGLSNVGNVISGTVDILLSPEEKQLSLEGDISLTNLAKLINLPIPNDLTNLTLQDPSITVTGTGTNRSYELAGTGAVTLSKDTFGNFTEVAKLLPGISADTNGITLSGNLEVSKSSSDVLSLQGVFPGLGAIKLSRENNKWKLSAIEDGDRLTLSDLAIVATDKEYSFTDLFSYEFKGDANLGIKTKTSIQGNPNFPSFSLDVAANLPLFNYGDQAEASKKGLDISFNDITLDAGTFISNLARPVIETVDTIIDPIKPVVKALNADTKFLSYIRLENQFNQDNKPGVSLIDIAQTLGNSPILQAKNPGITDKIKTASKFSQTVTDIVALVETLNQTPRDESFSINFGDFKLDSFKAASQDKADSASATRIPTSSNQPRATTVTNSKLPAGNFFTQAINKLKSIDVEIPLIDQPTTAFKLVLGQTADLIKYDIPDLDFGFNFDREFQIYTPPNIKGLLGASFNAKTDFSVGFDTFGLNQWKAADYKLADSYKVLDGFYLDDWSKTGQDKDEMSINAQLTAGLALDIIVAEASLRGGIDGNIRFDLEDVGERNGTSDGKVRGSEIVSRLNRPLSLFELTGTLEAFLKGEAKIGIWRFKKTVWSQELGRFRLAEFKIDESGFSGSVGGRVSTSYIADAFVYLDANFNQQLDDNEPITKTNNTGEFNLEFDLTEFDKNENGKLDDDEGQIVALGGLDSSTGVPLATQLITGVDSAMLTPLTNLENFLVKKGYVDSLEDAEKLIAKRLGLSLKALNIDLEGFDPLEALSSALVAEQEMGIDIYLAHIKVQNLMIHADAFLQGLKPNLSASEIQASATQLLAEILTSESGVFDLDDPQQLQSIFSVLATLTQKSVSEAVVALVAQTVANSNLMIDELAAEASARTVEIVMQTVAPMKQAVQGDMAVITHNLTSGELTPEEAQQQYQAQIDASNFLIEPVLSDERTLKIYGMGDLEENSTAKGEIIIELGEAAPNQGLNVLYSLSGTATLGEDYQFSGGSIGQLYIEPGATTVKFEITPLDDTLSEGAETIAINLRHVGEGFQIDPEYQTALVTLMDDEPHNSSGATLEPLAAGTVANDVFEGTEDDDSYNGNYGDDQILGKGGSDRLQGNYGDDTIEGGDGNDILEGNYGMDYLEGNEGDDQIQGGDKADTLVGGDGNDQLNGQTGDDLLKGSKGNDLLEGSEGNDRLEGEQDNDWLLGGSGNDILIGGEGQDALNGGDGADRFVIALDSSIDNILDFDPLEGDKIVIDVNSFNTENLNDFQFIGGYLYYQEQQIASVQNDGNIYNTFSDLSQFLEFVEDVKTIEIPDTPELSLASTTASNLQKSQPQSRESQPQSPPSNFLEEILQRGYVKVGIIPDRPGFAEEINGELQGYSIGWGRALAAALFGDPSKVEFVPQEGTSETIENVANRQVDVATTDTTVLLYRDAALNIDYSPVHLYDSRAILVKLDSGIQGAEDLEGLTIGVTNAFGWQNLQNFMRNNGIEVKGKLFNSTEEMYAAYERGEIDALTGDRTRLKTAIPTLADPNNHLILDEEISQEPIAMVLPENESEWADVVRWVTYTPIQAEEYGITSANIDQFIANSTDPAIRRFLGLEGTYGEALGLSNDFVVNTIKSVGNYGEIAEQYFPALARCRNELSSNDGLIYSLPFADSAISDIPLIENDARNLLAEILQRGSVKVGVADNNPGFAQQVDGDWTGIDTDLARAISAALFGNPNQVEFVSQDFSDGFANAANGVVDVSAMGITHTSGRDGSLGIDYSKPYFYTGAGILARTERGITSLPMLNGHKVGVIAETTTQQNLEDALARLGANVVPIPYESNEALFEGYKQGEIDALVTDLPIITSKIPTLSNPSESHLLDEMISKEPLALVIDENQSDWADVVNWVLQTLVEAEKLGITQSNVDQLIATSTDPEIRRFLGVEDNLGGTLGLSKDFAAQIIKAVGNYGEIYNRNFDATVLPRDMNERFENFGLQYALPFGATPESIIAPPTNPDNNPSSPPTPGQIPTSIPDGGSSTPNSPSPNTPSDSETPNPSTPTLDLNILGTDSVMGSTSNEQILGNEQDNLILALDGNDRIQSADGNDTLIANTGNDTLEAGNGNDLLYGGQGDDVLEGQGGEDTLFGDKGNDTLAGGIDNDWINGNQGNDIVNGNEGDDILYGGQDNDQVLGGTGNDTLFGDRGDDTLAGGEGSDRFFLMAGNGSDLVSDFQDGEDLLLLDEALTFEQLQITAEGNATVLQIDSQILMRLQGVNATLITQDDFVSLF